MEYTNFVNFQGFKENEPVRCTKRQADKDGFLKKNSLLIIRDTMLLNSGVEKIKRNENPTGDDIEYMCLHIETGKYFWIKESQLKKAVDEKAINIVNEYHRKCFKKNMRSVIVGGLICIFLLMFAVSTAMLLMRKIFSYDLTNNIEIIFMFIGIIIIVAVTIAMCIEDTREYKKKIKKKS